MATLYVRKEGLDTNNGTTVALAKLTIASAMTASASGGTIDIGEGGWYETIGVAGKTIIFQGTGMYKTTIVGTISIQENSTFNDMTVSLNANFANGVNTGVTLNRVRILGNGYGSTQVYFLYYGSGNFVANYCIFHGITKNNYLFVMGATGGSLSMNHCTVFNSGNFYNGGTVPMSIKNSIMYNCAINNNPVATITHKNNLWYPTAVGASWGFVPDATEIVGQKPLFVDITGGVDYLRDGSPGISLGVAT